MTQKKVKQSQKITIPRNIYLKVNGEEIILNAGEKWEIGEKVDKEKKIMTETILNLITGG